ncbi:hypothetical protein ACFLZL_05400 [Thermodesulfobacteriota bacterium]
MTRKLIQKIFLNHKGSVLIAMIVTVVILAALGAAMVSLTSTSMSTLIGANSSARAFFLAESGYRYAENQYINAVGQTAKDNELETMHDASAYTLLDNAGQFDLKVYPYFFKISEQPTVGTKPLKVKLTGGFPPDATIGKPGWLQIGPKSTSVYQYDDFSIDGATGVITFQMTDNIAGYYSTDLDVLSVVESKHEEQTITEGGTLNLHKQTGYWLPFRNGTVMIDGHLYRYKEKTADHKQLIGIVDAVDPSLPFSITFPSDGSEKLVLQKFVELYSTGLFGQNSVEGASTREVAYQIPLPTSYEERKEFEETFADKTSWETDTLGTTAIQDISGNVLKVTGTGSMGGTLIGSLIGLKWSETELELDVAHASGDPYFLSYDAQVKVGFDPSIPQYYGAGISFRLDNDNNSYGLSFLRGDDTDTTPYDNLDNNIVPDDKYGENIIVLWQQTNSGTTRKWLAYRDLNVFYKDDVELGVNGWTATGIWHRETKRANSETYSWAYNTGDPNYNYSTGARSSGSLISPEINLCKGTGATLTFWSWYQTEDNLPTWDQKFVYISADGGSNWTVLDQLSGSNTPPNTPNTWEEISLDLSAYIGQKVLIRFYFDSIDEFNNAFEGWYVDDVKVSDPGDFTIESALMVRVQESASVTFTNGGTTEIEAGDTIVGQTSGARGTVVGAPIIDPATSGTWAGGTAAGTLLIKNVTGSFQIETVYVIGSATAAQITAFRTRDNFIKAYYADTEACGTANDTLLDNERLANSRNQVHWPTDDVADWSASTDYFTLVQWDTVEGTDGVLVNSEDEPNAIIRSNTITSPTSGVFSQPELGLHALGMGATSVYFDDFAAQTDISSDSSVGFSGSIQQ